MTPIRIRSLLVAASLTLTGLIAAAPSATAAPTAPAAPATTVVEESDAAITYTKGWKRGFDLLASGFNSSKSSAAGSTATIAFLGTTVTWIGTTSFFGGKAEVFLDGVSKGVVDTYSRLPRGGVALYSASGLSVGKHTLQVKVLGKKSLFSLGTSVDLDRIRYTPAPLPTIGFTFDDQQYPVAAGLSGVATCSRPLTVNVAYSLVQGAITRTGTVAALCNVSTQTAGIIIDGTGLVNGPAILTWTSSWSELNQSVKLPPKTATVQLNVATTIGLTLDGSGYRGTGTVFVGGSVTCSQGTSIVITGILPTLEQATQTIDCAQATGGRFLLQWDVAMDAGIITITATAKTGDGLAGVDTSRLVTIT